MGCSPSKGVIISMGHYGPTKEESLVGEEEEDLEDPKLHEPVSGWPYEKTRFKEIDYKAIIDAGEPWTDPDFKPDAKSLFING